MFASTIPQLAAFDAARARRRREQLADLSVSMRVAFNGDAGAFRKLMRDLERDRV